MLDDTRRRAGLRQERIVASPQWFGGRFRNIDNITNLDENAAEPLSMRPPSPPFSVIREFLTRRGRRIPDRPLPLARPLATWARPPSTGLRVTWLGHSTLLLEIDGRRLLTDPVFGLRASPLEVLGPKRFHPVPVELDELPPLDAVLLTHDHYDHLCRETMTRLARSNVPIVTSLGVGAHLVRFGVDARHVTELDWEESAEIGGLHFTATPAQHFSGRGMGDRNRTLWSSFVIAGTTTKVFFSGDTGLTPKFRDIGRRHGPFDLVMLEIGAFHPAWGTIHLGPRNALRAFEMLGGGTLLPIHWGTFNLALHDWDEPAETLLVAAAEAGQRIITPGLGAAVEPAHLDGPTPWWRRLTP